MSFALAAAPVAAQAPIARLTLAEAVSLANAVNPSVRAKEFELQAVGANEITAGLRPNPTATFLAEQFGSGNVAVTQYTFSVGQPIELGGKRQRRIDSAKAQTRVTGHELTDLRRQIVFQVKKSFTDILVARAAVTLAEQNLAMLDELERVHRSRAEKGDISGLELLRIEVERFAFERDAADARQALRTAMIALRTAIGQERVAEEFDAVGDLAFPEVTRTRSELFRMALDARPDLQAAQAAREKASADINLAKANAWWDVTPQIEYQRIGPDNTIGFGFALPIKLFDRNQGEIARARAEAQRLEAAREALLTQALAEVDSALATVTAERQKATLLRDTYLPKVKQARETIEYAYQRGGVSLLDFLDAQRTYREKSLEYLRSLASYRTAVYVLEAAVGGRLEN
ncbi:MAG TPA: TolC family protein [Candidatus Bathyarchaeia archaeon]|nr:TolC family protein [Candidatus Bathyarchaeia archaeon]